MKYLSKVRVYDIAQKTGIAYDYLLCMLYEHKCSEPSEAYYYNQLSIHYLPQEVIYLLWPENTVHNIVKLFWEVYKRVEEMEEEGVTSYDSEFRIWQGAYPPMITWIDFFDCWLYKTLSIWVQDENVDIENRKEIKKTLMDVAFEKQSNWL